eukprot:tig00000743_g3865.t1
MQKLRDSRGVHVETAITAAGGLAGLALLRSAGTGGISIEAELASSSSALMLFFSGVLVSMKLSLQEGQAVESIPQQNRSHKQASDLVKELEVDTARCLDVLKVPRVSASGRDILGGRSTFGGFPAACGACIAAARFVQLAQAMLDWRVGIKLAYDGFVQVAQAGGGGERGRPGPYPSPNSPRGAALSPSSSANSFVPTSARSPPESKPANRRYSSPGKPGAPPELEIPSALGARDFRRSPLPPPAAASSSSPLAAASPPASLSPTSPGPGPLERRSPDLRGTLAPGKIRLPPLGGGPNRRITMPSANSPPSPTWHEPAPRPSFTPAVMR